VRVLFYLSQNIYDKYFGLIKEDLNILNDKIKSNVSFYCKDYYFNSNDIIDIKFNPDAFLFKKEQDFIELNEEEYDVNIFVPDVSVNLKGNYIWYSRGDPYKSVLIVSSYIFKKLIESKIDFSSYLLLVYAQFIARYTVVIDTSHIITKNCLNDHCADQIEILNVLNEEKSLCKDCLKDILNDDFYKIIQQLISFIKKKINTLANQEKIESKISKVIIKPETLEVEIKPYQGKYFEFEIFMAKKCINLSDLYAKIYKLLSNPSSEIDGYSLYEVDGGWRGEVKVASYQMEALKKLKTLNKKYGKNIFKDLIKPMVYKNGNCFALFDERSIVLKIIFKPSKVIRWDPQVDPVIREITELFSKITKNEKSIYFTLKELYKVGSIQRTP